MFSTVVWWLEGWTVDVCLVRCSGLVVRGMDC